MKLSDRLHTSSSIVHPVEIIANTQYGRIRGRVAAGVSCFKAVPYAAPPVGPLRFRKPVAPQGWADVRDALEYGCVAVQHEMPGTFGEVATPIEPQGADCLHLNIWTPDVEAEGLPVMIWIHGGGYFAGAGSDEMYDGAAFARDGVVCVSINYRLGAEAFLYLDGLFEGFENSGCNGTADQLAALQWVQQNIANFGGDPEKVTIAGESAGAFSVATLMAAPAATGLFRHAISQSGGAHNVIAKDRAAAIAAEFLRRAAIAPGDMEALQDLPAEKLIAIQAAISQELMSVPDPAIWGDLPPSPMAFQPVIGTDLVPAVPLDAIAAGSSAGIPVLAGWNADETLLFIKEMSHIFSEEIVRGGLAAQMAGAGKDGNAVFDHYRANRPSAEPFEIAAAAQTDAMFRIPTIRLAEAQAGLGEVYIYRFDWPSRAFGGGLGAYHISEVPFVFDTLVKGQSRAITGEGAPGQLASAMHGAWTQFIKTGRPGRIGALEWPTYDSGTRATMIFDLESRVEDDPAGDERELWSGVIL